MKNYHFKKIMALALAAATALSITACTSSESSTASASSSAASEEETTSGSANAQTTAASGDSVIHVANDADPGSLAPWGSEGARNYFVGMLYQPLIKNSVEGERQYILAKEINQIDDFTYDVTIYDYIVDSEGNAMTASDVVFSYEQAKANASISQYMTSLDYAEAIDEYTVEFHLTDDAKIGALEIMMEKVMVITEAAWDASADEMVTTPVGTAPYTLVEYVAGSYGLFEKNENYWQTDDSLKTVYGQSNIDLVYIDIISERATQAIALETGELDASQYINSTDYVNFIDDNAEALDGYQQVVGYMSTNLGVYFNCSDNSPFADINLRKAFCYALDREELAYLGKGIDGLAVDYENNPLAFDFDENYTNGTYYYDPDLAKEYLAKSSYNGETLTGFASNATTDDVVTMMITQLGEVGINIDLSIVEDASANDYRADNTGTLFDFELYGMGVTGYSWTQLTDYDATRYENGVSHIFIEDDTLTEKYNLMSGIDTASVENTDAFMDYLLEECYRFPVYVSQKRIFAGSRVKTLVVDDWYQVLPGACELY